MKMTRLFLCAALAISTACGDDEEDNNMMSEQAAEPRGAENPPTLGTQIDRNGRAVITSALVGTFNGDTAARNAVKDAYNAAVQSDWASYTDEMVTSLAILDGLDANCGNQLFADGADGMATRYTSLASVLADDQLYVNSASGTCGTYLGLEAEIVGAISAGAGGCGGRTPDDDVIDRSYSVLANGSLGDVGDTIDANDVANPVSFPYLAAPN